MSRVRWIALGVLVVLLSLFPLLPRGGGEHGAIRTTGDRPGSGSLTAGYGRVTPTYQRTIDRVVASGRSSPRLSSKAGARTVVDTVVRCARFEGQRYCLGDGWTDRSPAAVRAGLVAAARYQARGGTTVRATGDLSAYDELLQRARMRPVARAAAERAELTQAARSVAKVWLVRHQIERVPLPPGFLARHPEVRQARLVTDSRITSPPDGSGRQRAKHWKDYPNRGTVLDPQHVTQQHLTYWCGPTTMQMIAWGWSGAKRSQQHWADRLGTTTSGSSISAMVDVVNSSTGYDKESYAGPYITLDIGDWSFKQWRLLMARHIVDYRAPVVLHPVLLQRYYPYLDHDGSGHFQVGRGYRKHDGRTLLGYFEPWNQQRFHPDEPFIDRVQWRNAYKSYRANEAHFQHNLGV
jgi:Peptidase_C39 like family